MTAKAHPWLAQPSPKTALPREQLEARIEQLLATQNMCVVATLGKTGPVASPVEYYNQGLTIYFVSNSDAPKLRNMERDPRISVAIFQPLVGWTSARGCQLFGRAEILRPGTPEHAAGMEVYAWQKGATDLGRGFDRPPQLPLIKLAPDRIVYTEHYLRKEGYAPRQTWRRTG
jgi:nitroimidazol reductase NimA-like FMN-containing flavoprotein (pyridoxamine 5'-phosphate oxidase superfamily)